MPCAPIVASWSRYLSFALLAVAGCAGDVRLAAGGTTSGSSAASSSGAGGSGGATGGSSATSASAGTGGGGAGMTGSIKDVNTGVVGAKVAVHLAGVVAMSRKVFVAYSKETGTCLWGVFLSDPNLAETAPFTGILATSYGTPASIPAGGTSAQCPVLGVDPTGDAVPDDVAPGDVLDVAGETDAQIAKSCAGSPGACNVPMRQIHKLTSATKIGSVTPPALHVLTDAEIAQVASPCDAAFVDQWAGARVRLKGVTGAAGSGEVVLAGSGLEVGGPFGGPPGTSYTSAMVTFTQIDGFVVLDACVSKVDPLDRCVDLQPPPSVGCP